MADRFIELVRLDSLKAAPRNPKSHSDEGIDASLNRFGYVEAILLDERTDRLVAGHGRLKALRFKRDAQETPPDGVHVAEDGEWLIPVQRGWSSHNDAEAEAYLLASNELTVAGGWGDQRALAEMLEDLNAGPGLDGTGFAPVDLEDLLIQLSPPSLEDLRKSMGREPTEEDMWPVVRLKLSPLVRDEFLAALGDDGSDDVRIRALLARLVAEVAE